MEKVKSESLQIQMYLDTLQTLSESTDDYLYLWELKSDRVWFFGNLTEKYHLASGADSCCTAKDWESIVYPRDIPALSEELNRIAQGELTAHNMEYRLRDKKNRTVWVNCRGKVQKDAKGNSFVMVGRVSETVLWHKVDSLTGLFNVMKMTEDFREIYALMEDGFLIHFGVDNLKSANIKNGYEHGNRILQHVAKVLEEIVDDSNWIYRVDGDTFAVYMPGTSREEIQSLYDRVVERLSDCCTLSAGAVPITKCSDCDTGRLHQYAEEAMDKAKQGGGSCLAFFSEEDYAQKLVEIALVEELTASVEQGCRGFSLVYQPQIRLHGYRLFGAEALLRYDSPVYGRVMPDCFISLLERTGLICQVGQWVLQMALEQCRKWRQEMPDFHISVNMSYVQLNQPGIMQQVLELLEQSGVPGEALTLEVTESMQLQDFQHYNRIFSHWSNAGIEISVDDFGTGYSSLGYLKHLRIDEIKIDRCFVRDIQNSSYNYRLLSSILELAGDAQIHVCCEGVEEKEELQVLEQLKPDLLQGYFFSKPCEVAEFETAYFGENRGKREREQKTER